MLKRGLSFVDQKQKSAQWTLFNLWVVLERSHALLLRTHGSQRAKALLSFTGKQVFSRPLSCSIPLLNSANKKVPLRTLFNLWVVLESNQRPSA